MPTRRQPYGQRQPNGPTYLVDRNLMEWQQQQATAAQQQIVQRRQAIQQKRAQESAAQRQHLSALHGIARWLHTPFGAIMTLAAFVVGWILFIGYTAPIFTIGLPIALAIIDWRDYSSFHGAIPWNVWLAEGKYGRWWALAIVLALYGWFFMPVVFAIQAWRRASDVKVAKRAELDTKIAALEAELAPKPPAPPPPAIPPPPPPNPITRRYATDQEYTEDATQLAKEGWNVTKVSRASNNDIVVNFAHRTANVPPNPTAER